jgi:hypothetical protein
MAQLTPVPEFENFGFEALFAPQASGHVFEFLPPTMTRNLESTVSWRHGDPKKPVSVHTPFTRMMN